MKRDINLTMNMLPSIEKAYNEILNGLSYYAFLKIVVATFDYIILGKLPSFKGIKRIVWTFMKPIADEEIKEMEREDE